jgi:hypothetical protein
MRKNSEWVSSWGKPGVVSFGALRRKMRMAAQTRRKKILRSQFFFLFIGDCIKFLVVEHELVFVRIDV